MVETWLKCFKLFQAGNLHMLYEDSAKEIKRKLSFNKMPRLTLTLAFLDSSCPPKPWEQAPTYVFPIFRDHLNVVCRMKMLNKDQRIESPIESAKSLWFKQNKVKKIFDSLEYHVVHGPAESSPSPSSKSPGRLSLRRNALMQMSEVQRT